MAKRKSSMDDMDLSSISAKPLKEATSSQQQRPTREPASPMLGEGRVPKRTERKVMRMPVSGEEVTFVAQDIIPADTIIHPHNQRIQSLLRLENPRVYSLYESMKTEKQREAVHSRWVTIDGERKIEILDGSRRRFVGVKLHEEDPSFRLKAWVAEVGDADAAQLAKAGNSDREDISPWELGQYLAKQLEDNPGMSHEVLAHNENMSRTSVSNHLAIADIPIDIVSLLESPHLLKLTSGLPVLRLIKDVPNDAYLEELQEGAPYKKMSDLANRLKAILQAKSKPQQPSANRKVVISQGETVRAEIGKNRAKPGQYKIDLYKVTDEEYAKIMDGLKEILAR